MTRADDLGSAFECAARPGAEGDPEERPVQALLSALGPDLNADGACNAGFLRDDSLLVVTLITDEEDDHEREVHPDRPNPGKGSDGDPSDWFDAIVKKTGSDERVIMLALVGVEEPDLCDEASVHDPDTLPGTGQGSEFAPRIHEFVGRFGNRGKVADICLADYTSVFASVIDTIDFACDNLPEH